MERTYRSVPRPMFVERAKCDKNGAELDGGKMYVHRILLKNDASNQVCFTIISKDSVAYDKDTALAWLDSYGYKVTDTSYNCALPAVGKVMVSSSAKVVVGVQAGTAKYILSLADGSANQEYTVAAAANFSDVVKAL